MTDKDVYLKPEENAPPKSQRIFGSVVYWTAIVSVVGALIIPAFILANPANNVLNPNTVFGAIFAGESPAEIWEYSISGEFPGAHYYLDYITKADSWAMIFIVIGCAAGFLGLVCAVFYQLLKEKDWFCVILGTMICALIFFSMAGIISA